MAIMAIKGPLNTFGQAAVPPGMTQGMALDYNGDRSPSMFDQGAGIADPRYFESYLPGNTLVLNSPNDLRQQGTKAVTVGGVSTPSRFSTKSLRRLH